MDHLILSRIQFAANMSFHILFPTITIALCWLLLFFRLRYVATRGTPAADALGAGLLLLDQDFCADASRWAWSRASP